MQLASQGLHAAKIRAPHYLGLRRDTSLPVNLLQHLAEQHIYVSVRGPALRVTPHLYTGEGDIERLVSALKQML